MKQVDKPLTHGQERVLRLLDAHEDGLTDKAVASRAQTGMQGAQAILRTLMTRGLVSRERVSQARNGTAGGVYSYTITDAGERMLASMGD